MMNLLIRLSSSLNGLFLILGAVVLCLMMALATLNMISGFLGQPIKGAYEITGFLGALAVCMAMAPTQQARGHITVTIFDRFIPRKARLILGFAAQIVLACFCLLIIRQLVLLGFSLRYFGELSESLRVPFYPLIFILASGFGAMVLTLLVQLLTRDKH